MANRLQASSSPYLLQHATNPVDWYPWCEEALEKARAEDKPIFLSIGYSACHWCHVMERESFQDQKVADILNKVFVPIKVDREERPDIDAVYMSSVVLMTGSGGWPTSVWLTPDLKPFYGGTYFPPTPRHGQPSFAQILLLLASGWRDRREQVIASADELISAVARLSEVSEAGAADGALEAAVAVCQAQHDARAGGFGGAPKFPQAMTLRFLLIWAVAHQNKDVLALVEHSAEAMARGGIYDQLGGGFHRYSVDADWTVPHFEKMLYDNALLLGLYADLVAHTGKALYLEVARTLVGWLEREMALPHGGFACSQDADSEGEEGRFFVWTPAQLEGLDKSESKLFCQLYGVSAEGNFEGGASVLTRRASLDEAASQMWLKPEGAAELLESARRKALEIRSRRPAPNRDDKALASWNAQMVSALCRAARLAGIEKARELALRAGDFLKANFTRPGPTGELPRLVASSPGDDASGWRVQGAALAEDVGSLCLAFFDLYELTLEDEWQVLALEMFDRLRADYWDEEKALTAMTTPRTADLPLRPFSFEDNATPSAHSLLMECARRHHRLTGDPASQAIWSKAMNSVAAVAQRAPTGLGLALQSAALARLEAQDLILSGSAEQARDFLPALQGRFLPNLLVARVGSPALSEALSAGKEAGQAYLCSGTACQPPVSDVEELRAQLSAVPAATHS